LELERDPKNGDWFSKKSSDKRESYIMIAIPPKIDHGLELPIAPSPGVPTGAEEIANHPAIYSGKFFSQRGSPAR
jgi:hypothetical protein